MSPLRDEQALSPEAAGQGKLPQSLSHCRGAWEDRDVYDAERVFRSGGCLDSVYVEDSLLDQGIDMRGEGHVSCEYLARDMLGGEDDVCPGIPEVPFIRELVHHRKDPGPCHLPQTKDDARGRLLLLLADNNVPRVLHPRTRPRRAVVVIAADDVHALAKGV